MKKAFTLIEVMVVLSILAIIAILAYNFFGGTMKEAKNKQMATQLYNEFRIVSDGIELYYINNGAWPTATSINSTLGTELGAYLKALPANRMTSGGWIQNAQNITYAKTSTDWGGTATGDDFLWISGMPYGACDAYNDMYSGKLGEAHPTYAVAQGQKPLETFGIDDTGHCDMYWIIQHN